MIKRLSAEFIGTLWLVSGGGGSAVLAVFPDVDTGLAGVSLAFGLIVLTMAYAVGHISGAHFNLAKHRTGALRQRLGDLPTLAFLGRAHCGSDCGGVFLFLDDWR